ncbi:hypothetical protein C7H19_18220 [Aphanothece hegewaldii CCALA 016]|uniref:Sulfatase-modifying factor enzyme domain-containing protein n=1 Tax=Aphanothece hegewaldii CCALA 016 TaxID=2107694 RepID=A0A2T1LU21_9CHRO|nr:SUMF1/EgtB/PvdO family nonheme iron enzyme [Aphanothece hegewaldii]PSF34942.1 hypothetical protein C7H19_18220 [Aphanothece hegewaldii CCALA 016]
MKEDLAELLKSCTLKLSIPNKAGWGTGFLIAPDRILTCAHVVKTAGFEAIKVSWQNKEDFPTATIERFIESSDLALLRLNSPLKNLPCVYLDKEVNPNDDLYTFGYPDEFPNGAPVTFSYEGLTGDSPPLMKFKLGQARPGLSGSPLLNMRTGKVCGMAKFTLDRGTNLGGGGVPMTSIYAEFRELEGWQKNFHENDQTWSNYLKNLSNSLTSYNADLGEGVFLEMVPIPYGTFMMGTPKEEIERLCQVYKRDHFRNEGPQRQVSVSSFYMGKYPVTQEQWRAIARLKHFTRPLKEDPSKFKGHKRPVENVSWKDAIEFCKRLSKLTGKKFRLPSEAEWEYACRAGTETPFHFGETISTKEANYNGNYNGTTDVDYFDKVISSNKNGFGLYDLHGNVWEWCQDPWHGDYQGAPTDGRVWDREGEENYPYHVMRGGAWNHELWLSRSATRNLDCYKDAKDHIIDRGSDMGFRVVCELFEEKQNMNTLTPQMFKDSGFSEVLGAITKRLDEDTELPSPDEVKGTNIGNYAPNAQGSNIISSQNISGNTFIGTQNNYNQLSEQKSETKAKVMLEAISEFDIGIIVALREEFRELFSQLPSPQAIKDEETGVTDYLFKWEKTVIYHCAATFVGDMGLEKAALATERFIKRRQPKTVVMLGIAGGMSRDVKLGDVVVVTTANNYLDRGKAVTGGEETFTFEMGGDTYRCSDDLARAVQDMEFAHSQLYREWQEEARKRKEAQLPSELPQKEWLRDKPEFVHGAIASGSVVGATQPFIDWLKKNNRNYLAIEMEGAGMLSAVYSHADPKKTLILRGISDFADERKQELDQIRKGGIRRYAMNNAITLMWKLLEAQILPKNEMPNSEKTQQSSSSNQVKPNELLDTLRRLIPAQFNELSFRLNVPNEYLPHQNTPQIERATALLTWASAPGGIGLTRVKEVVNDFLGNP